jgi:hypothetical protein
MGKQPQDFSQLKGLAEFSEDIRALERLETDFPSCLNKIRFITEKVLYKLCAAQSITWGQGEPTLERMIGPLLAAGAVPKNVGVHLRTIQTNTSPGSHYQESPLSETHVNIAKISLFEVLKWFGKSRSGPPSLSSNITSSSSGKHSSSFSHWMWKKWLDATIDIPCWVYARNAKLRVACPVFLKIGVNNRFFLIRVPKEAHEHDYIPIGGVLKHHDPPELQALGFEPDCPSFSEWADRNKDLRGCMLRKRLPRFRRWLRSERGRESDSEGLRREIAEELSAIGLTGYDTQIAQMQLDFVREVHQRTTPTPGFRYQYQYRRTVVFEASANCHVAKDLQLALAAEVKSNPNLILVSASEILRGRADNGEPIAHNAPYLFSDFRIPGEPREL